MMNEHRRWLDRRFRNLRPPGSLSGGFVCLGTGANAGERTPGSDGLASLWPSHFLNLRIDPVGKTGLKVSSISLFRSCYLLGETFVSKEIKKNPESREIRG